MLPTRENILTSLETRDRYAAAAAEGAALRGELGVQAYVLANGLEHAPVAIDVADFYAAGKRGAVYAAILLGGLTRPQYLTFAWAYASYLNQRGVATDADRVLAGLDELLVRFSLKIGV